MTEICIACKKLEKADPKRLGYCVSCDRKRSLKNIITIIRNN